ncbi:unnamed protein product [marine sediment metagenome]|uniref:Helix-turn-helix domain-containing protein n=1 Tax=marine sediment metagenome TaxID=412755 RepID=X1RLA2_9ZZZZ
MTSSIITQQPTVCQAPPDQKAQKNEPISSESLSPPASPQSTAHHNALPIDLKTIYYKKDIEKERRYGVPQTYRILTMGNYHKHHDDINNMLRVVVGLENRERSAVFCLLRLFLYYGKVYPKAADVAEQEYISKRTFWRAIGKLRDLGVIEVLNRYVKHRQISNCYRLDKLVVMLATYIAEHHLGPFISDVLGKNALELVGFFRSWDQLWDADINLSLVAPVKLGLSGGGEVV